MMRRASVQVATVYILPSVALAVAADAVPQATPGQLVAALLAYGILIAGGLTVAVLRWLKGQERNAAARSPERDLATLQRIEGKVDKLDTKLNRVDVRLARVEGKLGFEGLE